MNKTQARNHIENYLNGVISDLEVSLSQKQQGADIDESDVIDQEDLSHGDESDGMVKRLKQQVLDAKSYLAHFNELGEEPKDVVLEGALVKTEDMYFYVGASTKIMDIAGEKLVGLSIDSPLFKELFEKQAGFKFMMGNKPQSILEIS